MPTQHISIDIETAARTADAAILSIGAVAFDPKGQTDNLTEPAQTPAIHIHIGLSGNPVGRRIEGETLQWWEQHPHRQETLYPQDYMLLNPALCHLAQWVKQQATQGTRIWLRGPQFDAVILEHAYDSIGSPAPWKFWQLRDVRTACDLALPELPPRTTTQHHALADAVYQAQCVQQVYARMQHIRQFDALHQPQRTIT